MQKIATLILLSGLVISCSAKDQTESTSEQEKKPEKGIDLQNLDTATLAGGCFWCVEAAIEQIVGVAEVVSGYSGGTEANAEYRKVASGQTKHAEAVQVYFDPKVLSYEKLLEIFFTAHDPTQLNRQGPDVGPQYRTAIFYHNEEQKRIAEAKIDELQSEFDKKIVTEINELDAFYLAEDYHQDYQKKNPYQPYIMSVSKPKTEKVKKKFPELIKD
jgi:peptide-methionine (S)-S-oxide reductase